MRSPLRIFFFDKAKFEFYGIMGEQLYFQMLENICVQWRQKRRRSFLKSELYKVLWYSVNSRLNEWIKTYLDETSLNLFCRHTHDWSSDRVEFPAFFYYALIPPNVLCLP